MVTFILYGMLVQSDNLTIFHKTFYIFYSVQCMAQLFLLTQACARIVSNNIKIFKANRTFCYVYSRFGQPNALCLLKMGKAIGNYKGTKNGFRLLNNFLLDSKMYEIVSDTHSHTQEDLLADKDTSFPKSSYLNLYGYPEELDYTDLLPFSEKCLRVDAFSRTDDVGSDGKSKRFQLPEGFADENCKLIYLSLGSMGSVDIDLMQRIVSVIAKTPYKCIISKGVRAAEYDLPDNCWGEAYLPQADILPHVDLVITHGGNNTTTESFAFGKPMIVMPLFSDQYDSAQRVHEMGYGIRVDPYSGFKDEEFSGAIERLLNDEELKVKLDKASKRIKQANSKDRAVKQIEILVQQWKVQK